MIALKKTYSLFLLDIQNENQHLLVHKSTRNIPAKNNTQLLLYTWNMANLGLHNRADYQLIAEIFS